MCARGHDVRGNDLTLIFLACWLAESLLPALSSSSPNSGPTKQDEMNIKERTGPMKQDKLTMKGSIMLFHDHFIFFYRSIMPFIVTLSSFIG